MIPAIRPRRTLALPFFSTCYPILSFIIGEKEVYGVGRPVTEAPLTIFGLVIAAIAVSYAVAVAVDLVLLPEPSDLPSWTKPLFAPSMGSIAFVIIFTISLGAYLTVSSIGVIFPEWADNLAQGIGLVLGLPTVFAVFLTYLIGDIYLPFQSWTAAQQAIILMSTAFTAAWIFVVASQATTMLSFHRVPEISGDS